MIPVPLATAADASRPNHRGFNNERSLFVILICQAAFAGAPIITELQPRGVERGHPFTLTISGRNLAVARAFLNAPGAFTQVNPLSNPMG